MHAFRRLLFVALFFLALLCAPTVFAAAPVGYVTVSGSNLQDSTGALIANATISFAPVNNEGVAISYQVNGRGQAVSTPVTAMVSNGAFTIQLADTSLTAPANVCYAVTVIDSNSGNSLLGPGYTCFQPAGSGAPVTSSQAFCTAFSVSAGGVCNFDVYSPNMAALVVTQTGPTGPNTVSTSTTTNVTGLLKGVAGAVAQAVAGTDYDAAGAAATVQSSLTAETARAETAEASNATAAAAAQTTANAALPAAGALNAVLPGATVIGSGSSQVTTIPGTVAASTMVRPSNVATSLEADGDSITECIAEDFSLHAQMLTQPAPGDTVQVGLQGAVTAFQIDGSNNVTVTIYAANLKTGATVVLHGMMVATYLNGVPLTITSQTSTSFTAVFAHAAVSLTNDFAYYTSTQTITFVSSGATGFQSNIGSTTAQTVTNLYAMLSGSSDTTLAQAIYTNPLNNWLTIAPYNSGGVMIIPSNFLTWNFVPRGNTGCYVNRVAGALGLSNLHTFNFSAAVNGSCDVLPAQLLYKKYSPGPQSGQVSTTQIGTNNVIHEAGVDLATFNGCLNAALAWKATPYTDKVMGSSATAIGTCSTDSTFDVAPGEKCTASGSTLTYSLNLPAAATVYAWPLWQTGDAGTYTYRLDNGSAVAQTTGPPVVIYRSNSNGLPITQAINLIRIPGVAAGSHTLTFTQTGAGTMEVFAVGYSPAGNATVNNPIVIVSDMPNMLDGYLQSGVNQYRAQILADAALLQSDPGVNLVVAPVSSRVQATTASADMDGTYSNGIKNQAHLNTWIGNGEIYQGFMDVLQGLVARPQGNMDLPCVGDNGGGYNYLSPSETCFMSSFPGYLVLPNSATGSIGGMGTNNYALPTVTIINGNSSSLGQFALLGVGSGTCPATTGVQSVYTCAAQGGGKWMLMGSIVGSSNTLTVSNGSYSGTVSVDTTGSGGSVYINTSVSGGVTHFRTANTDYFVLSPGGGINIQSAGSAAGGTNQGSITSFSLYGNYNSTGGNSLSASTSHKLSFSCASYSACGNAAPARVVETFGSGSLPGTFLMSTNTFFQLAPLAKASYAANITSDMFWDSTNNRPAWYSSAATVDAATTSDLPLTGTTGSIGGSALTAGQCTSGTATVTGAAVGMASVATPAAWPGDGYIRESYISSANTATVKLCAIVAGTPTATTYNVRVIQ